MLKRGIFIGAVCLGMTTSALAKIDGCEGVGPIQQAERIALYPTLLSFAENTNSGAITKHPLCPIQIQSLLDGKGVLMLQSAGGDVKALSSLLREIIANQTQNGDVTGAPSSQTTDTPTPTAPLDSTPPIISDETNHKRMLPKDTNDVTITFDLSAFDDVDGVVAVQYFIGDQTIDNQHIFGLGQHLVKAIATDRSGNAAEVQIDVSVEKERSTERPLSLSFDYEILKGEKTVIPLRLSGIARDGDGRPLMVRYFLDDGTEISANPMLPEGKVQITAMATDANGRIITSSKGLDIVYETPKLDVIVKFEADFSDPKQWLIPDSYIVMLTGEPNTETAFELASELGIEMGMIDYIFQEDPYGFSLRANEEVVSRLATHKRVRSIGHDYYLVPFQSASQETISQLRYPNDSDWEALNFPKSRTDLGDEILTKRVYVIDTGVWDGHDIFGGGLETKLSFAAPMFSDKLQECTKHGTAMASLIKSQFGAGGTHPEIIDMSIQSCGNGAYNFTASQLAKALSEIHRREKGALPGQEEVFVVNLSLGAPAPWTIDDNSEFLVGSTMIEAQIKALAKDTKAIIIAAAGNAGIDACRVIPAYMPETITIGATDGDKIADFSNFGPCISRFTNGINLEVADTRTSNAIRSDEDGTSGAAATVTGWVARLLSEGMDFDDIQSWLHYKTMNADDLMRHIEMLKHVPIDQDGGLSTFSAVREKICYVSTKDVVTGSLNVRVEPDHLSTKIASIDNGSVVVVSEISDGRWIRASSLDQKITGWMADHGVEGQYLKQPNGAPCSEIFDD